MAELPRRRLTLTFDNGPTSGVTEYVLDELAARDIEATFFVVGQDLLKPGARELAERASHEGHWLGNHTLTHSVQFGRTGELDIARREIDPAQEILGSLSHPDRFVRPWGNGRLSKDLLSAQAVQVLRRGHYSLSLWNCVPRDWEDPEGWPDTALATVETLDWTVLVLHDQATGAMDALPSFLDALEERGVEIIQEIPDVCVPIRRGRVVGSLEHLMRDEPPEVECLAG